jgi:hypothetical protein
LIDLVEALVTEYVTKPDCLILLAMTMKGLVLLLHAHYRILTLSAR